MKIFKKLQLTCLVAFLTIVFTSQISAQKHFAKTGEGKTIDFRLVGEWEGSEEDNQIKGMTKQWKMIRTEEGKFILDFKATKEGITQQYTEVGTWWVKNGKFNEFHENSGKTDTYAYEVLNEDQVKFKAIKLGVEHNNQEYEFIDTRVK